MSGKLSAAQKRQKLKALHEREGCFVIPNPWDIGTTRILESMGFEALATTSAGMAFSLGIPEGQATKDQTISHCKSLVEATDLPVSADLEKGFGDTPESVAQSILLAGDIGLAGASIEDHTGRSKDPIFDFNLAVERVAAAVEASRQVSADFVFTARCENRLWGVDDLDDTIKRLQAYESAGADVLYAPGLHDIETIELVCTSLSNPVNVVMGMPGATIQLGELAQAGVKRVSVGSALARAAFGTFVDSASEIRDHGSFTFSDNAIGFARLDNFFK